MPHLSAPQEAATDFKKPYLRKGMQLRHLPDYEIVSGGRLVGLAIKRQVNFDLMLLKYGELYFVASGIPEHEIVPFVTEVLEVHR